MKLGSLKGGRDGRLVVVDRALSQAVEVAEIASTLQAALDAWLQVAPKLEAVAARLDAGEAEGAFAYNASAMAAPLPRAPQFADGSAYLNHVELVRRARGAEMPPSFWHDPLMYQAVCDSSLGPCDDIVVSDEAYGIDFEAEVTVVLDDVAMGVTAGDAAGHIKLVMLVNDVSLRNLIPGELAKGFGFFHGKPASAFSPLAVTPDELGPAWRDGKLHRPLACHLNGEKFGSPDAGSDMAFSLPELVAHAAKTRRLSAGTIIGTGTVSNKDASNGFCCIAEVRMIEAIEKGAPETPFMSFGDTIRIEMLDQAGQSIFGAIEQTVRQAQ